MATSTFGQPSKYKTSTVFIARSLRTLAPTKTLSKPGSALQLPSAAAVGRESEGNMRAHWIGIIGVVTGGAGAFIARPHYDAWAKSRECCSTSHAPTGQACPAHFEG